MPNNQKYLLWILNSCLVRFINIYFNDSSHQICMIIPRINKVQVGQSLTTITFELMQPLLTIAFKISTISCIFPGPANLSPALWTWFVNITCLAETILYVGRWIFLGRTASAKFR